MSWTSRNWSHVLELTGAHLVQSVLPLLIGVLVAVPVARLAARNRVLGPVLVTGSSLLYTIPSLTLFVVLPLVLGTQITSAVNVVVALAVYVVAILVRSSVDAFESVDRGVLQASTAMGYRPLRRFLAVELPLAVPVLVAGLRVASVSNISMVSVGAVIGVQSLGTLFTDGLRRSIVEEIVVGIVLTVVLALLVDLVLRAAGHVLTPWRRADPARAPLLRVPSLRVPSLRGRRGTVA